jgi:hypothetical protein
MCEPSRKDSERKNPGQKWLGNDKAGVKCSGLNLNVRTNSVSDDKLSPKSGGTWNKEAKYVADLGISSGSVGKEFADNLGQKWLNENKLFQKMKISYSTENDSIKKVHLDFLRSVAKCCCRSNTTLDSKETRVMQL